MQYADLDASSGDAGDRATTFTWRKVMIRSAVLLTLGVITLAAILPAVGPPGSHAIQPAETVVVVIGICLLVAAAALPVRVVGRAQDAAQRYLTVVLARCSGSGLNPTTASSWGRRRTRAFATGSCCQL